MPREIILDEAPPENDEFHMAIDLIKGVAASIPPGIGGGGSLHELYMEQEALRSLRGKATGSKQPSDESVKEPK